MTLKQTKGANDARSAFNQQGVMVVFPKGMSSHEIDERLRLRGVPEQARWLCPTVLGDTPVTIFYGGR